MNEMQVMALTAGEDVLGESPVWRREDNRLFWVDIRRHLLRCLDVATSATDAFALESGAMAVFLDRDGGLWTAGRDRISRLHENGAPASAPWRFELPDGNYRLNEIKCDPAGAVWFGTMRDFGLTPTGSVNRYDVRHGVRTLRADMTVPNALDFSPDGQWVYCADTRAGSIERARFDAQTGITGAWSPLIAADAAPGKPDGLAVDSDGFLWNARFGGGCVARFSPSGQLDSLVTLPVSQPTSCVFGGRSLTTLYITTARQGLNLERQAREPLAGAVFACETAVAGHPAGRLGEALA